MATRIHAAQSRRFPAPCLDGAPLHRVPIRLVSVDEKPVDPAMAAEMNVQGSTKVASVRATTLIGLKRKRAKHGPEFRESPLEDIAISKAIRTANEHPNQPIFLPHEGLEFNSFQEAKEFYNLYSWEIGFNIRIGRTVTNGNDYTTRKDLVCSCEDVCEIPADNIHPRWARTDGVTGHESISAETLLSAKSASNYMKKNLLLKRLMEVASEADCINDEDFASAMEAIDAIKLRRSSGSNKQPNVSEANQECHEVTIQCPKRPTSRGRPQNTSLQSFISGKKLTHAESTDEENPKTWKTRSLSDVMAS